jgi:hypothetical protein
MAYLPLVTSIIGLLFSLYCAVSAIRTNRKVRMAIAENRARAEASVRESNVLSLSVRLSNIINFESELFSSMGEALTVEFTRGLRELIQQGGDATRLATLEELDFQASGWNVPQPEVRYSMVCSYIRVSMELNGGVVDLEEFSRRTLSAMTEVLTLKQRLVEPQSQPEAPEPERPTAWKHLLDGKDD